MTFDKLYESVATLSDDEVAMLRTVAKEGDNGILRIFMDKSEIKHSNKLAKLGLLDKGKSDDKKGSVIFSIAWKGEKYLNNI
jgi:hypothetical protein